MTEYTARSAHAGSTSTARAYVIADWVHITSTEEGKLASTALNPADARTFARGILALCDKVDGGEAEAPKPAVELPKIGTSFRVTRDNLNSATVRVGDEVEVSSHHGAYFGADLNGTTWYFRPKHIGNGLELLEEPLADWERELIEGTPEPAPIKVGDRVRIVRAATCSRHEEGRTGVVDEVDDTDPGLPYAVVDENGDFIAWAKEVDKVDNATSTPAPSTFAAHVEEAKRLLTGTPHSGADVVALAIELDTRA